MTLKQEKIYTRLQEAFAPSHLEVLNESGAHIGHAGYTDGDSHFAIHISASCFAHLSRVAAHQQIYALFNDMIPNEIHALKIKII